MNKTTLPFAPPCLTVDIEDWAQGTIDDSLPITHLAAENTLRLLSLLEELKVKVTCFVLGKFTEKFPEIVKLIDAHGHEVGSHGYGHVPISKQTRMQFQEDLRKSKVLLENLLGKPVIGYRAPFFSITRKTLWALAILAEEGFHYDSSIYPVSRPQYGIPDWPIYPTRVKLPQGLSIIELPLASIRLLGKNRPIAGGGYHRLLPGGLARWLANRLMQETPFIYYCHPYEFNAQEFRYIPFHVPWKIKMHQGLGRRLFTKRFKLFVKNFGGRRILDLLHSDLPLPKVEADMLSPGTHHAYDR